MGMAKANRFVGAAVALLVMAASAPMAAQAAELAASATLKADQPGAPISRYIYGQFSEHLGAGIL
jgi:alpha-N-arabinofuranosidase